MAISKNTVFVLVPGSFSPATFFDNVVLFLNAKGYEAHPVPLQSAGERTTLGPATMAEDAAAIRSTILPLIDAGKDVVVGMNSYGGFPGTESTKGLSKADRAKEGKSGGVVGLVYIAAFIPPLGASLRSLFGDQTPDSIKKAGEYMYLNPEEDYLTIFSDLPEDKAKLHMSEMTLHSTISFAGELTYAGWKDIPVTYLATEQDKTIPPEMQKGMIETAKAEGINVNVVTVDAGHCPMLGVPEKVTGVLIGAAEGRQNGKTWNHGGLKWVGSTG